MYRCEYPRPDFVREEWKNLNGTWDFRFEGEQWQEILVPFVFQSKLSGIGDNRMCDTVYYKKTIAVSSEWRGKRILLHFGAVDYECSVFVNGKPAGKHIGGNGAFSFDITDTLLWNGEELLEVKVYDPCKDETIPRGKQYWEESPESIWYTRSTGIWQTVWVEPVSEVYYSSIRFIPDIDKGRVEIQYELSKVNPDLSVEFYISFKGQEICKITQFAAEKNQIAIADVFQNKIFRTMNHHDGWCWSPNNPNLFMVKAVIYERGQVSDSVDTYFGMRKIEVKGGRVYLNNRPFYQKLILDQGYWPDTLMTAKEDEDFIKDIKMAKEMGFNGCRKHQKAEDPRFLYYADTLGYLVWSEIGSCISYSIDSAQRTIDEWSELVRRDYNHPCIAAWVVLNESWGVPNIRFDKKQQAHSLALYYHVRSLDDTRLIITNDGWEMTKSDICAIHNYNHGQKEEKKKQENFRKSLSCTHELISSMPAGRQIYADGYNYDGVPIMLTEFGGLAYVNDTEQEKAWGYTVIESEEEFLKTYERILKNINDSDALYGYCYTQLSDVEQEVNGLLTYDRKYKVAPELIKKINDNVGK